MSHSFLATCPAGVGVYLAQELEGLGAQQIVERPVGVSFEGGVGLGYRACLWSRMANRIILQLGAAQANSGDEVYGVTRSIDWTAHLAANGSLLVDFAGRSTDIRNAQFGAQRIKDAIVDQFRERGLGRPSVDLKQPDVRVSARLSKGRLILGIDLSGDSLHRRGYRLDGGIAPLRENIAAAALWAAGWPDRSQRGEALLDPMCGSATLLLEGALMALDRAPGLNRHRFGFHGWAGHDEDQWRAVRSDAEERAVVMPANPLEIRGYDGDMQAVRRCQDNIGRLGLEDIVRIRCKDLAMVSRPTHRDLSKGVLVTNPPWGERMGQKDALPHLYNALGERMSGEFDNWLAVVLTSDLSLGKAVGLRAEKRHRFHNGRMDLHCLQFQLGAKNRFRSLQQEAKRGSEGQSTVPRALSEGGQMVANRLRKNLRRLAPWLRREGVTCYRAYDADLPEYAAAIDVYEGRLHIAEYAPPKEIPEQKSAERFAQLVEGAREVFEVASTAEVAVKQRLRQRGRHQYQRLETTHERVVVREGRVKVLVNLHDYVDTGLFLDHRPLRAWLGREASGGHFLNLFSYTGVATLHAALGGATTSTSVDSSATYLDWFNANLALNGLSDRQHRGVRADVRDWLSEETRTYDLIMVDPPSFSNSKGQADFDVQRDHLSLLQLAMARLSEGGVLYFSSNHRKFLLDPAVQQTWQVKDVTQGSIPEDFSRNQRIHACWRLTHS
ncbi:MAG TPA: bifunctional 23S rRNA (guanine(2069)-N(7))-methyltransferase RlmK/23S rRNA (guanine(2445)-N(2))-methyltransferase RlmL [Gammaproteobacteria bacterium]|nr:bifunctional 23S rRNA (guanine(2069)-N(7))-methyltransferase RlmK/23S rRNA (guanine(2445)-N(2))-methyltransferase RlmL [Gammaproteobacteria bacterium]